MDLNKTYCIVIDDFIVSWDDNLERLFNKIEFSASIIKKHAIKRFNESQEVSLTVQGLKVGEKQFHGDLYLEILHISRCKRKKKGRHPCISENVLKL